jgi:hypothetical protein
MAPRAAGLNVPAASRRAAPAAVAGRPETGGLRQIWRVAAGRAIAAYACFFALYLPLRMLWFLFAH